MDNQLKCAISRKLTAVLGDFDRVRSSLGSADAKTSIDRAEESIQEAYRSILAALSEEEKSTTSR